MGRPLATDLLLWNRFLQQILFSEDGCWEWQGAKAKSGYGVLNWRGRVRTTHRIAWEFWYGDPGEAHVLHHCDNRSCVRLEHLFLGTNQDNINDMVAKNRQHKSTFITFNGETLHLKAWARRTGLSSSVIAHRLKHGWSTARALTAPVDPMNHSIYMVKA